MRSFAALTVLLLASGCLSRESRPPVRWFEPALPESAPGSRSSLLRPVRVQEVYAARHLAEAMVWRLSDVELAFDETNLWADTPAELVTRALERELGGRTLAEEAPTAPVDLTVGVERFDVLAGDRIRVEVRLFVTARAPHRVTSRGFRAVRAAGSDGAADIARAMGTALAELAAAIVDWAGASESTSG